MKAKGNYVVILKETMKEERKQGGLYIPPSSTDDFFEAVVLDSNEDAEEYFGIIAGERVLVKNHGFKIKIGNKRSKGDIYVVEAEDVLCSVENDEDAATLLG